ncbi:MAG: ankyrin repeat domain-containing protein [Desulfobacterales bacterium]
MKLIFRVCTIIFIPLIMASITYANKDLKGSSDYPLISRMPGFWIAAYQESEYDSHTFLDNANNKIIIEGHKYFIEYRLKKGGQEPGRLMILNNHENALKKIDAEILKRTKKDLYCKVTKEGKEIWIQVRALDRLYRLTIVEREQVEQKIVDEPDASPTDNATTAADIHEAAKKGALEKVKAFLANGEKVDVKDKHGLTPLYLAACEGHKDVCEYLISQGADVNAGREIGFVPLTGALNNRTESGVEIFKLLVAQGADININIGGYPLLHQAVASCHNESVRNIAKFLISKGVDINAKGYQDKTPLHMVGCRELGELLLLKGADIEARDKDGRTPIFKACSTTLNKEVCDFFISKGADIEARDKDGCTPLWKACSSNELKVCEFLILKGADIEARDKDGRTPLWKVCSNMNKASSNKNREICEFLISKGADIEARDKDGQTPLWKACSNANMGIAKLLISKGADVNAKDNRGWTPLRQVYNLCLTTRNTGICDLLKKHGGVK